MKRKNKFHTVLEVSQAVFCSEYKARAMAGGYANHHTVQECERLHTMWINNEIDYISIRIALIGYTPEKMERTLRTKSYLHDVY